MDWYKLADRYPDTDLVLAYDNYNEGENRFAVCEADPIWIKNRCNDGKLRTFLYIKNSIAPGLSDDSNAYWTYLPKDDDSGWNLFETDNNPFNSLELIEVLIKLKNGNLYVGFIESFDWCPSFNMFKHGELSSIKKWMPLPDAPN